MATNWKNVDKEVLRFVAEVARVIKVRRDEYIMAKLLLSYQADAYNDVVDEEKFLTALLFQVIRWEERLKERPFAFGSTVGAFFVRE